MIRPTIQIIRNKKGETNILKLLNNITPNQGPPKPHKKKILLPIMKKMTIKNGQLTVVDMHVSTNPVITKISDLFIDIKRPFLKKSIITHVRGKINNKIQPALFRVKAEVQDIAGNLSIENLLL